MAINPKDPSGDPKTPVHKKAAAQKTRAKKVTAKKGAAKKAAVKKGVAKSGSAKTVIAKSAKTKSPAKRPRVRAATVKIAKPAPAPTPERAPERAPEPTLEAAPKQDTPPLPPPQEDPVPASLQHMPVTLFGAGLGLTGFATAWREAAVAFEAGGLLSTILAGIAFGIFVTLVVLYTIKFLRHRQAVLMEFRHPIIGNFFSAATMTLMILSTNLTQESRELATILWMIGAVGNVLLTICFLTFWIARDCHISHATPIWFIPVVSNMAIPIVGAPLGYPDIGWMMFAVAMLFWLTLFTVVFYRLLFERPLEDPLRPSLFILIAPPSLAFIAYAVLNGGVVDGPAKMFLGIATFMLLMIAPQIPHLLRLPFGLNWWSYSFPLAAYSVACTLYADAAGGEGPRFWAIGVIAVLSVLMLILAIRTVKLILAGKVFRPVEAPLPKP